MPGAYAHLTLVGMLSASNPLNSRHDFPQSAESALLKNTCYCDLGAVSPDYPYLDILNSNASSWADLMHYENTGKMLKSGVEAVRALDEQRQGKAFAWLLGYAAHVVADTVIHPIIELKVGSYAQNKKAHRVCEMHQDAYIFQRLNIGPVGLSEYLDSGIRYCSTTSDGEELDEDISVTWQRMLEACHSEQYRENRPDPGSWHKSFLRIVDKAEEGGRLVPFARHVAVNAGLTYPAVNEVDPQYILKLRTPEGAMGYDDIFGRAMERVLDMWTEIAVAVYAGSDGGLSAVDDWNLDTGRNMQSNLVFWEATA